ncbi:MAG TPA: DUF4276 family protein [Vicinamibacteria bacterium]|nr:DUF4276 family protein [Vicinamibacteria bacterium]
MPQRRSRTLSRHAGVFLTAALIGKPGHKGGVRRYAAVRQDFITALKEDSRRFCTTMFDYYGLPSDWPELSKAKKRQPRDGVKLVEKALLEDVAKQLGFSFDAKRFLPYIQLHEFEALLFSDPDRLASVLENPSLSTKLQSAVDECGEPEAIDDHPDTTPSKRIIDIARHFQKTFHGAIASTRIGLDRMREKCPHFHTWVNMLEALGSVSP